MSIIKAEVMSLNKMKPVNKSKIVLYFIVGIIFGIVAQLIGGLKTANTYWHFSCVLSNIDVYPLIIVFLIHRDKSPQYIFKSILLFFVGLCIGYYLWTTILAYNAAIRTKKIDVFTSCFIADLLDGISYSVIGLMAAIWGYIMGKNKEKKILYYLMIIPFFTVTIYQIYLNLTCVVPNIGMTIVDVLCLLGMIIIMNRVKINAWRKEYELDF